MVPAAVVDQTLDALLPLLDADDVVIDGGNSNYRDDQRRAKRAAAQGVHYVDCGTSGGVWGLERGYSQMIGGDDAAVERLIPIFKALAPGVEAAERTPGRDADLGARRGGLAALRPARRRPLREDGPQRDRVRDHGRLRRGPEHPQARERRRRAARRRRRDRAARRPRGVPVRPRPDGRRRGVAARQRDRLVAARPDGRGARRLAAARRVLRPRLRLGRGPLDGARGDRGGRARADPHRRAVRALRVAGRRPVREQGDVGDARAVRRARGEDGRDTAIGLPIRRRRHRRLRPSRSCDHGPEVGPYANCRRAHANKRARLRPPAAGYPAAMPNRATGLPGIASSSLRATSTTRRTRARARAEHAGDRRHRDRASPTSTGSTPSRSAASRRSSTCGR